MSALLARLLLRFPWIGNIPWKLIAYLIAMALLFGAGWKVKGWKDDAADKKAHDDAFNQAVAAYKTQHDQDVQQHDIDTKLIAASAKERDALQQSNDDLRTALSSKPLVEYRTREVHDETGNRMCPDAHRGNVFRVCYDAAISGDAASCTAGTADRGDGAVPDQPLPATR